MRNYPRKDEIPTMTDTSVTLPQVTPLEDLLAPTPTKKQDPDPTALVLRLLKNGADVSTLSIPEILTGLGVKNPSAVNLQTLLQMPDTTMAASGLPLPIQQRVTLAIELTKRLYSKAPTPERLDSPEKVAAFLSPMYSACAGEVFGIIALDSKHRVLGQKIVATGGRHSVAVTPADVYQAALTYRPRSIVAFHNHPSGDPHPSEEDKALTYRLARSGEVLGIALVDHVVLGSAGSFASFKQLGLL